MSPDERRAQAHALQNIPLLHDLLDEIERGQIEATIYAADDGDRFARAAEVRAIRSLRTKLAALIAEANPKQGFSPV